MRTMCGSDENILGKIGAVSSQVSIKYKRSCCEKVRVCFFVVVLLVDIDFNFTGIAAASSRKPESANETQHKERKKNWKKIKL